MYFSIEINQAIEWTIRFVSICILVDTFEKFCNFREFKNTGIFSWEWLRQNRTISGRRRIIRRVADLFFGYRVWFGLLALRGIAALGLLLLPTKGLISAIGLLIIFIVGSLANFRRVSFMPETPNRFTLTIIGALFLQSVVPSKTVTLACLWFIALQSCLTYATAGIIKLFNPDWRNGVGLLKVVNSPNLLTSPNVAVFFQQNNYFGKILNYFTLAFECLFPLVLVIGKPFFILFLIWGLAFHFANMVLLRFNNFFWAWIATYPAIIFIAQN